MPLRKYKKRSAPRRRPVRRARRTTKPRGNTPEYASLSCARTMTIVPPNPGATTVNTMYAFADFKLADFPRAVQVAGAYQHYRVSGIKLTFKPNYDTYAPGNQKQFLYYMIDKADAIPGTVTLEGLKQMGARPRTFDEKSTAITWRPSVVMDAEVGAAGTSASYKVSPWLSTNANAGAPGFWNASRISHKGLKWYIEAPGVAAGAQTVYVEVELQFQFKKPLVQVSPSAPQAIKMSYPPLDDSPDGVEGGTDGITQPLPA